MTGHEPAPEPSVGQDAYVPSGRYLSHGRDDFSGGLCEIIDVTRGTSAGTDVPFVEFKERPGDQYLRPEFNRDWEEGDT